VSHSRHVSPEERRPAAPLREADDRQVTLVITTGWVLALIIVFCVRNELPADQRWWVWTCLTGVLMGLFGLWYVPRLQRSRARAAARRAADQAAQSAPLDSGSNTVSSTDTPGKSTMS